MDTINGQTEQQKPQPIEFEESEIYELETALKERAVRVLNRKWAQNTKTEPFAIISRDSAKEG